MTARPQDPVQGAAPPGLRSLDLGRGRDALVYVPPISNPGRPAPLVVLLHGAGGDARQVLPMAMPAADELGVLVLAPQSSGRTWDVIMGGYGPDVRLLDQALTELFARHAVDPARIAIGGFSDGASYALSLGIMNGDLFTHILAFSPGFMAPLARRGTPSIFISHGVQDQVLRIGSTSRALVPTLREEGYAVEYEEFEGGHVVPPAIARAAIGRLVGTEAIDTRPSGDPR